MGSNVPNNRILHLPSNNPIHGISASLQQAISTAQGNDFSQAFRTSAELCQRAFSDLRINIAVPASLNDQPATELGNKPSKEIISYFEELLTTNGIPAQAIATQAAMLSHRIQLLRAFDAPDTLIANTCNKVKEVVDGFPKTADDIRCGSNPGDVLDPYILAAAQILMCSGDFERTVSATISHKVLMIIEGLLGHLHEDVIGSMRGNVRIPEPRAEDQETLNPMTNPFPGADLLQPPTNNRELRFFQVKSKTGSAKGGDGRRLGEQLHRLVTLYGGSAFYVALIGNTLRGHRSMAGVQRAAPSVVVLVGESAFQELTGSIVGPQLLLRLYQSAFEVAARDTGYSLEDMVATIYHAFRQRADDLGEGFLEAVLHDAISGPATQQDSRHYVPARRQRRRNR